MNFVFVVYLACENDIRAVCTTNESAQQFAATICERNGYENGTDVMVLKVPTDQEFNIDAVANLEVMLG